MIAFCYNRMAVTFKLNDFLLETKLLITYINTEEFK